MIAGSGPIGVVGNLGCVAGGLPISTTARPAAFGASTGKGTGIGASPLTIAIGAGVKVTPTLGKPAIGTGAAEWKAGFGFVTAGPIRAFSTACRSAPLPAGGAVSILATTSGARMARSGSGNSVRASAAAAMSSAGAARSWAGGTVIGPDDISGDAVSKTSGKASLGGGMARCSNDSFPGRSGGMTTPISSGAPA
jgi:hypothetical protein